MFRTRKRLVLLLFAVFLVNLLETNVEAWLIDKGYILAKYGYVFADTLRSFEGPLSFEYHDYTNIIAVYGYSASYFFILPLLSFALAIALGRRREVRDFQVFCYAVAFDYLLSLPFFLFFPVVERWANPSSGAILLSDLWSSKLIEVIRPISGLNNSFPSFHVSLSAVIILVSYFCKLRLRTAILGLSLSVILSTFVLGIHWLGDMATGLAIGALSVALALRCADTLVPQPPEALA